jgi:hypothetical protein
MIAFGPLVDEFDGLNPYPNAPHDVLAAYWA